MPHILDLNCCQNFGKVFYAEGVLNIIFCFQIVTVFFSDILSQESALQQEVPLWKMNMLDVIGL